MNDSTFDAAAQSVAQRLKADTQSDAVEKHALLAILTDDTDNADRLLDVMKRRNERGLFVVKDAQEVPARSCEEDNEHPV